MLLPPRPAAPIEDAPPFRLRAVVLGWLVLAWLAAVLAGTLIGQQVAVTGPATWSLSRASFFAASAASLTGFEMSWTTPATLSSTHIVVWIGLVLWTALLSLAIATAAFAHVSGVMWRWRGIWVLSAGLLAGLMVASFIASMLAGRPISQAAWDACIVPAGAGLLRESPAMHEPILWLGYFPLAMIAGLGPFILWDTLARRGRMAPITRLTWLAVPASFLLGVLLMAASAAPWPETEDAAAGVTAAIDARGRGFADNAGMLPAASRWMLVPVILLGGAAGTGGGLKAVTAAVLLIGLVRLLRGGRVGRTFAIACTWLLALLVLFGVTFLGLVITLPQLPPDRLALLAAGACGNAGISVDPAGAAGADGYVLGGAMLLGRLLPWVVLYWSATRGDEPVAVG